MGPRHYPALGVSRITPALPGRQAAGACAVTRSSEDRWARCAGTRACRKVEDGGSGLPFILQGEGPERAWELRWRRLPIPGPGRPGDSGGEHDPQADDLQQALHREPPDPVLVPGIPAKFGDRADFAGGVQDVGDALVVPAAHRSTDSARMARSRVFSPPAETTSSRGAEEADPAGVMARSDGHDLLAPGLNQQAQRPGCLISQLSTSRQRFPSLQDNNGTCEAGGSACSLQRHCLRRKRPQGRIFGAAEAVAKLVEGASP
jgi:hypothetical protein